MGKKVGIQYSYHILKALTWLPCSYMNAVTLLGMHTIYVMLFFLKIAKFLMAHVSAWSELYCRSAAASLSMPQPVRFPLTFMVMGLSGMFQISVIWPLTYNISS